MKAHPSNCFRILAVSASVLLRAVCASGAEITLDQAESAVEAWISRGGSFGMFRESGPVEGTTVEDEETGARLHLVRVPGQGIVVTSADDRIKPVLAFAQGDDLDGYDPDHPFWALMKADIRAREVAAGVKRAGKAVAKRADASSRLAETEDALAEAEDAREEWAELLGVKRAKAAKGLSSIGDVRVAPLLETRWGQGSVASGTCWNYYTPQNYPCGCNATAMAQIMRYWKMPSGSVSPKTWSCKVDGKTTKLTMMGGTYSWSLMPAVPNTATTAAQRKAMGQLAYDAAVSLATIWEDNWGTSCVLEMMPALKSDYGYKSAVALEYAKGYYEWSLDAFKKAVIPNLDKKCPVALSATGNGGHTMVADGYGFSGSTFYIHVNFGWTGSNDAWYSPPGVGDYPVINHVVCNVFPAETGNILSGRVTDSRGVPVVGATVKTTLGTTTTDEHGLYSFTTTKTGSFTITATYNGQSAKKTGSLGSTKAVEMIGRTGEGKHYATKCTIGNSYGNDIQFSSAIYQKATVTLNAQGGSGGTASVTATYGSAMPSITKPTRAGYSFGGYYTSTGGGGTQYYTASGASARTWDKTTATTLYAKWTANTYGVTLDRQNGTGGSTSATATYGAAMPAITVPTRTGYAFGGYYTSTGGSGTQYYTASGASARTWDRASATTLYAKWTINAYGVTLDRQGGTGGSTSATATYGAAMPSISVPTRTGYVFGGYYTSTGGSGTQYYTASGASARTWDRTASTTLYAKWTARTFSVTLDRQGGTGGSTGATATYGAAMPSISVPTRTGYAFGGYYASTGGSGTQYYTASGASARAWDRTAATTLYAKWTEVVSPVHRFYSSNYKGHFFTIDEAEKQTICDTNPNWKYEGVAYRAFKGKTSGSAALHRFYSKSYRSHFFTIDEEEAETVRSTNPNWQYEGISCYVFPSAVSGSVPVHRFWSKGYRHHFYTVSSVEKDNLIATDPNWKYEGVAFYALPAETRAAKLDQACPEVAPVESGTAEAVRPVREAPWMLTSLPGGETFVPDDARMDDDGLLVETSAGAPSADELSPDPAVLRSASCIRLFRLALPPGTWNILLWSAQDGVVADEPADGSFGFALPDSGAWHWLRVRDAADDEAGDAFSLWIRAE